MTPRLRNTILFCSSQKLPRLCFGPLKGLMSLHGALVRHLAQPLPHVLLPELQRIKDAVVLVCCSRRRGPRTLSRTTDTNLDCAFVENALVPKIGFVLGPPVRPPDHCYKARGNGWRFSGTNRSRQKLLLTQQLHGNSIHERMEIFQIFFYRPTTVAQCGGVWWHVHKRKTKTPCAMENK